MTTARVLGRRLRFFSLVAMTLLVSCSLLPAARTPRLIVVIVIDQMRTDYLTRFSDYFLPAHENDQVGGFNYLIQTGAVFWSAHYSHLATFTCPGHATILSGSTPAVSGIIGNNWFDASRRRSVLCVDDLQDDAPAPRTPRSLRVSTVGDELRLSNQGKSKVIAIGYKDYSTMALGGRNASLALWFDRLAGGWVSNDYYLRGNPVPAWVDQINQSGLLDRYRSQTWDRLLPLQAYAGTRSNPVLAGEREAAYGYGWTFPHTPPAEGFSYNTFTATPFANEFLVDIALAAIEQEALGQDEFPDLLALAFSPNDSVGHTFGPSSPEVMDVTLRTDRTLARLFNALQERFGSQEIIQVLTSDHGVQYIPREIVESGGYGGRLTTEALRDPVEAALDQKFGAADWVLQVDDLEIYLDHQVIGEKGLPVPVVEQEAAEALLGVEGILTVATAQQLKFGPLPAGEISEKMVRNYFPGRSGDVLFVPQPNWFRDTNLATTHGPPFAYNSDVPLILAGKGIRRGQYLRPVDIRDIAPTLSRLLGIGAPSGSSGRLLQEALRTP